MHSLRIEDSEMSRVSGQGLSHLMWSKSLVEPSLLKSLWASIQTFKSMQTDYLGEYELMEGATGSDVNISNISLGHISTDASKVELDGKPMLLTEIVPLRV